MSVVAKSRDRKDTGVQSSVRFDPWIHAEIEHLAKSRNSTFTDMVNHLLEYQLNLLGLSKAKYEAKLFDLIRADTLDTGLKSGDVKIVNQNGEIGDVSANTGIIIK